MDRTELIARLESAEPYSDELRDAVLIAAGFTKREVGTLFSPTIWWCQPGSSAAHWPHEKRPDPIRSIDESNALPGANITEAGWHFSGNGYHWAAYNGPFERAHTIGRCSIPGPEGEARARTVAIVRSWSCST